MAESLFIRADEVIRLLGVSKSEAYRIIKRLNDEMASKGYMAIPEIKQPDWRTIWLDSNQIKIKGHAVHETGILCRAFFSGIGKRGH